MKVSLLHAAANSLKLSSCREICCVPGVVQCQHAGGEWLWYTGTHLRSPQLWFSPVVSICRWSSQCGHSHHCMTKELYIWNPVLSVAHTQINTYASTHFASTILNEDMLRKWLINDLLAHDCDCIIPTCHLGFNQGINDLQDSCSRGGFSMLWPPSVMELCHYHTIRHTLCACKQENDQIGGTMHVRLHDVTSNIWYAILVLEM